MIGEQLLKNSSLYPLSKVANTKSSSRKLWWIFVLFIGVFGSVYQVTTFYCHYLTYPVVIDLKVESKVLLDFPAVTVCNLNRMRPNFVKCMEQNLPFGKCSKTYGRFAIVANIKPPLVISERRNSASCSKQLSGQKDKNVEDVSKFLTKYMALKSEDREVSGDDLQQLIAHCFFDRKLCKVEDFTYFQSLQYGNCFTFNKKTNKSILKVPSNGKRTELEIIFNLDKFKYLNVTQSHGARIDIHDPSEHPNPEERGINICPGFETSVKVKQVRYRRLKAPYTDKCIEYENNQDVPGKNQRECVQICIQELNLANCSCVDPTIAALNEKRQCNISNSSDSCCLDRVIGNLSVSGLPCKCPSACLTTNYKKSLSVSKWPYKWYKCRFCKGTNLNPDNMACLKVLYSTFEQTTYDQIPMFQDSQLYSNIGSLMSLWLGLSLLIVFEVTEMISHIIVYYYKRNKR